MLHDIDNRDPTVKSKPSRAETATRAWTVRESSRRQVFDSTAKVIDRRCYAPVRSARSARSSSPKLAFSLSYSGDRRNSRKRLTKRSIPFAITHTKGGTRVTYNAKIMAKCRRKTREETEKLTTVSSINKN